MAVKWKRLLTVLRRDGRLMAVLPVLAALLLGGAAVVLGMFSLVMAPGQYGWQMFSDYLAHPVLVLLNLLPTVVLAALLYGLTGRGWLAYLITAAVVLGLSAGNTYKLFFRDDPVLAGDLLLLGEAGDMAGKYQLFLFSKLLLAIAGAVLSAVLLALLARGKPKGLGRGLTAGIAFACALALIPVYGSDAIYSKNSNEEHINRWSTTQQYVSRGFLYPFLHSVKDALPNPPAGYDAKDSAQLLAEYEDGVIPEDKKVNVVGVMLEAFSDFSDFEQIEFTQDVYAQLHALEAESYSGNLLTNIFAGGTINTERAFLTGVGMGDHNYRADTSSYVWYLKSQGYHTSGSHPGNRWFYQRDSVNANLGFQEYYFLEDHYGALADGGIAYDDVLFPELARLCAAETEPYFSFTVTYQGHGPYPDNENIWSGESIDKSGCSESEAYILNNYFSSIANTSRNVAALADSLRDSSSPTVLLVFGDHKPWLGDNQAVYTSRGIPVGCGTDEGFLCHYSTQYLIWGNDAAKRVLGRSLRGEGPTVAPSMLMCALFDALGWEGPALMQEQRALIDAGVTMYHSVAENVLYRGSLRAPDELPEPARTLLQEYLCDAYYVQRNVPA